MKQLFYILLLLPAFYSLAFADEIYLNDLSIIKGKIIQVSDKNVEYSQENKPFITLPKNQVFKIIYDNGRIDQIADAKVLDKIFLKDGSIIEGTIVKVTADVVMYSVAEKQEAVVRNNIIKIVYADGKVVQISEAPVNEIAVEKEPEPIKEEFKTRSGGFIDSYIWIGIFDSASYVYGNLDNKENRIFEENKNAISSNPFLDHSVAISGNHFGFELNLLFPSIKFKQIRGFDLTGLKFGLKTTYVFSNITQSISEYYFDEEDDSSVIGKGTLLRYRSINAGPELNLVYSPKTDFFNMVVQFYTLGGYIHNGKLTAAPALRDVGVPITESRTADFTGYSFTAGAGLHFVMNKIPLILGTDFFYSYSKIEFDRSVQIYHGAKKTSFDEFGFTLSAGTHFWGAE
jgi:hypothetical protein